jgi:hypothetical protein
MRILEVRQIAIAMSECAVKVEDHHAAPSRHQPMYTMIPKVMTHARMAVRKGWSLITNCIGDPPTSLWWM